MIEFIKKIPGLRSGIGRRFILYILLFSSVITFIGTGLQLYLDFDHDLKSIHTTFKQVESSYLQSITTGLWVTDDELLHIQLEGILRLPDMQRIEIRKGVEVLHAVGAPQSADIIEQTIPLVYVYNGLDMHLGELHVIASLKGVYARIIDRVLVILSIQMIKTFLVSLFIFAIFYRLVGKYLIYMASIVEAIGIESMGQPLHLDQKPKTNQPDELDQLVTSFNRMRENLVRDISQRKKTEKELLESEERLNETAMIAKVGGWEIDQLGNTLSWTEETFRIHELEDEHPPDVDKAIQYYHPEDQQIVSDAVQCAIEKGEGFDFETRLITEKKNLKWVRSIGNIISQQGSRTGLRGIIQDITERKLVEEEFRKSEEKFKSLAENSQDYIMRYDKQGRHLYQNEAGYRVSGFSEDEFVGKTHRELGFDETLCILWEKKISEVFQSGKPAGDVFSWESDEGTVFLDWRVFPEFDNKRNVKTVLGVSRDISELKQAEEKIKASLKEKQTLLDEIHHRVKNNMNIISSLLKLQSNNIEDEQTKEILKDSQSRVYAMSAVHETLHGSETLSEIDLKRYLSKITTSVYQTYATDHRKVKLKSNVENSPISLNQAYPLGLVINELIANSLKYAFPENKTGEITVELKKLDRELELIIMDDGVGVPDSLDWKNSNTLGLKLVRTLVENQLDGSIDMESNNGTKFTIKFNIET
jgi:PAS domain S-box-containing protein